MPGPIPPAPRQVVAERLPEAVILRWNAPADDTHTTVRVEATGGTFTLTFVTPSGTREDGTAFTTSAGTSQTTAPIPFDATDTAVQAALEALSNIDLGDVLCTGGPLGPAGTDSDHIDIQFAGQYSGLRITTLTINAGGLTGTTLSELEGPPPELPLLEGIDRFHVQFWKTGYDTGTLVREDRFVFGEEVVHPTETIETYYMRVRTISDVGIPSEWVMANATPSFMGSDGIPPETSPTPEVTPMLGALWVAWTPVSSPDFVTYEVHVGTEDGFIPSAATLAGETPASRFVIKTKGDGEPLSYDVEYWVSLIAKDADGAADPSLPVGPFEPALITSPDIAADTILANHILAGEVKAEHMEALLVLANILSAGGTVTEEGDLTGQRVEISTEGLSQYRDIGGGVFAKYVDIPASGPAFFRAVVEALGLDVEGDAVFRGTDNVLAKGAALRLEATTPNPTTSPTLTPEWDSIDIALGTGETSRRGLNYDPVGFNPAGGTQPTLLFVDNIYGGFVREVRASDGVQARELQMPPRFRPMGAVRQGSYVYILAHNNIAAKFYVRKHLQSDLSFVSEQNVTSTIDGANWKGSLTKAVLGGTTYLLFVGTTSSHNLSVFWWSLTDTGDLVAQGSSIESTSLGGGYALDAAEWGEFLAFLTTSKGVLVFNKPAAPGSTVTRAAEHDFPNEVAAAVGGLVFTDANVALPVERQSKFVGLHEDDESATLHSNWTVGGTTYLAAVSWRNNALGYESVKSPDADRAFSTFKRGKLRVGWPTVPPEVDAVRVWLTSAVNPLSTSYERQVNPDPAATVGSPGSVVLSDFRTADADVPRMAADGTTFPTGTAARVLNQFGRVMLDGASPTGVHVGAQVFKASNQNVPNDTPTLIAATASAADYDTDGLWIPASSHFLVPATFPTAKWRLWVYIQWTNNANGGELRAIIRVNGVNQRTDTRRAAANPGLNFNNFVEMIATLNPGDTVDFLAHQKTGVGFSLAGNGTGNQTSFGVQMLGLT